MEMVSLILAVKVGREHRKCAISSRLLISVSAPMFRITHIILIFYSEGCILTA